jgi:hypothetical protein
MKRQNVARHSPVAWLLGPLLFFGCSVTSPSQDRPRTDPTVAPITATSLSPTATVPFTARQCFRFYEASTFAPLALGGPITGAAVTQWVTGNPTEWRQGFPGYGRRLLSGYSRQVIANTVALGVTLADGEDPRHYPTGRHGIWRRGLYAARETFASRKTSGGEMPDYSRIIGAYSAAFVANAWYPARESNTKEALYRGSTALASNMVWQLFKEFWPDVRRKLRGGH